MVESSAYSSEKHIDLSGHPSRKPSLKLGSDVQQDAISALCADFEPVSLTSPITNHKDYVIVRFSYPDPESPVHNRICNIELPLQITSNDLIVGLESAYHLGIDISNTEQCYLSCEYPIALLKGNRTLAECGVRDGSLISFNSR